MIEIPFEAYKCLKIRINDACGTIAYQYILSKSTDCVH